jgi:hypothetical protein
LCHKFAVEQPLPDDLSRKLDNGHFLEDLELE